MMRIPNKPLDLLSPGSWTVEKLGTERRGGVRLRC